MNLRHCPSFITSTAGSEVLIVFVLPDRLLLAVITRDQADPFFRLAQPLRDLEPAELLAADAANREVPLSAVGEIVQLPAQGPYEIQIALRDERPIRFRFEVRHDRDTIFDELSELLGERVPFVRQPPSRWVQAAAPLVLAGITATLGVMAYRWLVAQNASGGEFRLPWLFMWLYRTIGARGILSLFAGLAGLLGVVGLKRLLVPRRREPVTTPAPDGAEPSSVSGNGYT